MGFILDAGATVMCVHGGQAQAASPNPRVRVGGNPVTTQPAPHSVAGCPFVTGSNPMPCVTALWTTASTRVRAGGQPVLLMESQATCAPNGTPVNVVVTQMRVRAV